MKNKENLQPCLDTKKMLELFPVLENRDSDVTHTNVSSGLCQVDSWGKWRCNELLKSVTVKPKDPDFLFFIWELYSQSVDLYKVSETFSVSKLPCTV